MEGDRLTKTVEAPTQEEIDRAVRRILNEPDRTIASIFARQHASGQVDDQAILDEITPADRTLLTPKGKNVHKSQLLGYIRRVIRQVCDMALNAKKHSAKKDRP